MITAEEEKYILEQAYIPEHLVGLMTRISGGEPYLVEDFFCCRKEDWVILVGYPLSRDFSTAELEATVEKIKGRLRPRNLSLIAPEIPRPLEALCEERESDFYYTLKIPLPRIKGGIRRLIKRAMENVTVEHATVMGEAHAALTQEFMGRAHLPLRVRNLFLKMPGYVGHRQEAVVLNAWDRDGRLAAYYVVDLAARDFSAYVIGCHSKQHYVAGASDLLCHEMIQMSVVQGKKYVHLGLGVNQGIQKFKTKWGGIPTRRYEMGELVFKKFSIRDALRVVRKGL